MMSYDPTFDPVATSSLPGEAQAQDQQGELTPTPTTWFLVALWIVVYIAMNVAQGGFRFQMGWIGPGVIETPIAHEFGGLIAVDIPAGQVWRTITATFIHLSLVHLLCNLTCLIAFGRVLDSWYGGPQFFAIYLVIAALGNGFAVAGRYLLKGEIHSLSAGGSSVMFGLIALMAVVGWRARTRFGDFIRRRMVGKLVVFGLIIGIFGRNILDNYGHAGGALAGALVGLAHKPLIRWWDNRTARRIAFAASAVVVISCLICQARVGRDEYRVHLAERLAEVQAERVRQTQALLRRAVLYRVLATHVTNVSLRYQQMGQLILKGRGPYKIDPTIPYRREIGASLAQIDQLGELGTPGGDEEGYARWHELAQEAIRTQPNAAEIREFHRLSRPLQQAIVQEVHRLPNVVIQAQPKPPVK